MNPRWVRSVLFSLFLIGSLAGTATAQFESRGSVYGVVTDQEGLVLPGVTLALTSPALLQSQTTVSSSQGRYRFPALDPGEYRVEASLSGFQTVTRENLRVTGGLNVQANITLGLAGREETVTVVGTSPTIDFKQNDIHATWDATLVEEIPTERNINSLINSTRPGTRRWSKRSRPSGTSTRSSTRPQESATEQPTARSAPRTPGCSTAWW